jgi:octaprenyl-diphosphate synthase
MIIAEATKTAQDISASPIDNLHALVESDMMAADRIIHERMGSTVELIPDLVRHLVDSGGKRLRPLLTLAAARACGHTGNMHTRLAAAVEFIHTATLLHDDVVDASTLRRGKLAANMVWGNKPSVLVGDFLLSRAFQLMVETGDLRILHILAGASAVIAEGEVLQLRSANNLATTEADYLLIVGAKTAALFAASAESGATIANADPAHIAAFKSFGQNLGVAFQLIDDALDYSGRQALMGKSVGDDFREAKVTLPVILAYNRSDDDAKRFWQRTIQLGQQRDGDLQRAIGYIEHTGAIDDARDQAQRYARQACRAIQQIPQSLLRDALTAVAEFCVRRGY